MAMLMTQGNTEAAKFEKATFAGGCFWCMEPPYEKLEGVKEVISGYTGGHKDNPTYEEVSADITGHAEAVEIVKKSLRSTGDRSIPLTTGDSFLTGARHTGQRFSIIRMSRKNSQKNQEKIL
jgi:hypothetical protein